MNAETFKSGKGNLCSSLKKRLSKKPYCVRSKLLLLVIFPFREAYNLLYINKEFTLNKSINYPQATLHLKTRTNISVSRTRTLNTVYTVSTVIVGQTKINHNFNYTQKVKATPPYEFF